MNNGETRLRIALVDLSGEANIRYTPLALMGLKAALVQAEDLRARVEPKIFPFLQSHATAEMVSAIATFRPDIVAMSVQGWNIRQLTQTFGTLKQLLPDCALVLGGNHVTDQGKMLLPRYPEVDVIVDGEGEGIFTDLVRWCLDAGTCIPDARTSEIAGLTYRLDGQVFSTPGRPKTRRMEDLPSPYSVDRNSLPGYDIALLETNRGCPYHCAFCHWGGRVGQKLAVSGLDRVAEDIEAIAKAGIPTIFLCDANFGILEQDLRITEMIVEANRKYGAPSEFNVNWAKNHATRVGKIIEMLLDHGIHTAINIPMQTMDDTALTLAERTQAGRAEMFEEAEKLVARGADVFCELIFGLPGESLDAFKQNYDTLLGRFPVLRIHPLWILPNTLYDARRKELGIKTISPDMESDYEAIYEHCSMSSQDMRDGLAFLMAHSNINLLGLARYAMRGYIAYSGRTAASFLEAFELFLSKETKGIGRDLYRLYDELRRACYFKRSLRSEERTLLYRSREDSLDLVSRFLESLPISAECLAVCKELARFDAALLPRSELTGEGFATSKLRFDFDPVAAARAIKMHRPKDVADLKRSPPVEIAFRHKAGLGVLSGLNCDLTGSWNGRVVSNYPAPATMDAHASPAP